MQRNSDLANYSDCLMGEYSLRGAKSKQEELRSTLPLNIMAMHDERRSWMHDFEFFDTGINCIGVDIESLVGTSKMNVRDVLEKLFREIITLTNSQSGGIGFIDFDSNLAQYITVENDKEIARELRTFFENLNTFIRKGCEQAYTTLNFGLDTSENGRRITKIMLEEYSTGSENGLYIFPNMVFKLKNGVNVCETDTNFDLLKLSCRVTGKCMVPTYFNTDASFNKEADAHNIGIMGCRTRVVRNLFGESSSLFRGNIASTTINLVQLALKSKGDNKEFFKLLDQTMCEAKEMLIYRLTALVQNATFDYYRTHKIYLDSAHGNADMLKHGTLAIGFIGLYECVCVLCKQSPMDSKTLSKTESFSYSIIKYMREQVDSYTSESDYQFSLLATSAEGVSGKFPVYDIEKFGYIEGITDKKYYTNSFHVPVNLDISCFTKIDYESKFHNLCNGGCITYVELKESGEKNIEAILELITYTYNHDINYFGINFPIDICQKCGARNVKDDVCHKCGCSEILRLRRVSGYLSEAENFAIGKKYELNSRISHSGKITL